MEIVRIKDSEFEEVSSMIERTIRTCFIYYYPKNDIEKIVQSLNPAVIKKRASWTHFYVIKEENKIVGCGAIGPYWDSLTESCLFTIFVDPDYQGKGCGRKIIETLEQDEYFKRAKRIEIPASLFAIPFYRKMGYEYKNDKMVFDDGHFALEKFNPNYVEKTI